MRTGNACLAVSISEVDEKRIAEIAALIDVFDDGGEAGTAASFDMIGQVVGRLQPVDPLNYGIALNDGQLE